MVACYSHYCFVFSLPFFFRVCFSFAVFPFSFLFSHSPSPQRNVERVPTSLRFSFAGFFFTCVALSIDLFHFVWHLCDSQIAFLFVFRFFYVFFLFVAVFPSLSLFLLPFSLFVISVVFPLLSASHICTFLTCLFLCSCYVWGCRTSAVVVFATSLPVSFERDIRAQSAVRCCPFHCS